MLRQHLGAEGLAWAASRLEQLGALMGGPIAERAEETDRNPPRLEKYDRWGRDVSEVVMPATFEAPRRDLIEHNFSSPEFRDEARQAGVDPAPLSAAWAYLLDQAEIGMMCALGTGGDMVVRLADEFAPDDVKQHVRELFAAGEYAGEAAQMLTERTGGSDLAELETTATPDGDALADLRLQVVRLQRQRLGVRRAGQTGRCPRRHSRHRPVPRAARAA